jgi:hypothetical protein
LELIIEINLIGVASPENKKQRAPYLTSPDGGTPNRLKLNKDTLKTGFALWSAVCYCFYGFQSGCFGTAQKNFQKHVLNFLVSFSIVSY